MSLKIPFVDCESVNQMQFFWKAVKLWKCLQDVSLKVFLKYLNQILIYLLLSSIFVRNEWLRNVLF